MRKLKLELEELAVDTFATLPETAGRGTVGAREEVPTLRTVCSPSLLDSNPTCCPWRCEG
ncbi:MAG TPA: hypothetical protein VF746_06795 [Longimicrobium sp.]|jgi:hypothetical protein